MIVMIAGEVVHRGNGFVLVERDGLGFRVFVPVPADYTGAVRLFVHEAIRDNEREYFGFDSIEALELFWQLIGISGVGARIAQKIIAADTLESVKSSIMAGELGFLTNISGVGKKTAQKIILELKGVLAQDPEEEVGDQDAIEALVSLGYSRRDAGLILSGIDADTTEERIKLALRSLSS